MGKKYTVKDLNKNGKIDGWEQGKYDAINSATPMKMDHGKSPMNNYKKGYYSPMNNYKKGYYSMKMGSKQIDSPTNFSSKSAMLMSKSPMYNTDPFVDKQMQNLTSQYSLPDVSSNLDAMNSQYQMNDYRLGSNVQSASPGGGGGSANDLIMAGAGEIKKTAQKIKGVAKNIGQKIFNPDTEAGRYRRQNRAVRQELRRNMRTQRAEARQDARTERVITRYQHNVNPNKSSSRISKIQKRQQKRNQKLQQRRNKRK
jgi:hypothetical protein|tara:strand:- start:2393 stop:3160 length:768 start_codon:yes stop_codon:yes gene_type:complete